MLFASFTITGALLFGARAGWSWIPLDRPNARSLHFQVTPRAGGLAIFLAWLSAVSFNGAAIYLAPPIILVLVVSYIDDRWPLSPWIRLCAHILAAFWLARDSWGEFEPLVFVFFAVAMTNLTNFMDGANGLVAGVAAVCALLVAMVAPYGDTLFLLWIWLAAALVGFLPYNWGRGHIFLGDAGSIPLGLTMAALIRGSFLEPSFPVLVLCAFLPLYMDAVCTLLGRLFRRKKLWEAHREHLYQRLAQHGWAHWKIATAYIVATVLCGGIGYSASDSEPTSQALIACLLMISLCLGYFSLVHKLAAVRHGDLSRVK